MLSVLQPLDRYRSHSAIGSAMYLALSRIHTQVGVLDRLVLNRLEGSTVRLWRPFCLNLFFFFQKKKSKEKRERGRDSQISMPDMTGRPGCRTMEMFGGSTASYLARTPRIPLFVLIFIGLETKNVLDYQARAGSTSIVHREGANREKLTVKKIIK